MRVLLAASSLSLAPGTGSAAGEDGPDWPSVSWSRANGVLRLTIEPKKGSHLSPDFPLLLRVDDGSHFRVMQEEPVVEGGGKMTLGLPLAAEAPSTGWSVAAQGAVCDDAGAICLPWEARGEIVKKGPSRGKLEVGPRLKAAPLDSAADVAGAGTPAGPARDEARRRRTEPGATGQLMLHPGARWFDASREGEVEAAFSAAEESKRPLLIDFFAIWCPPCDRLRDEFVHNSQYLDLLAHFVLLRADADDPRSFALKERYAIGAYPTVMLLAADGSTLDRVVGYPGEFAFEARLRALLPPREPAPGAPGDPEDARDAAALAEARRLLGERRAAEAWQVLAARFGPAAERLPESWEAQEIGWRAAVEAAEEGGVPEAAVRGALAAAASDRAPTASLRAWAADDAGKALEAAGDRGRADDVRWSALNGIATWEIAFAGVMRPETLPPAESGRAASSLRALYRPARGPLHADLADALAWASGWPLPSESAARDRFAEGAVRLAAAILADEAERDASADPHGAGVSACPRPAPPDREGNPRCEIRLPEDLLSEAVLPRLVAHEGRMHDLLSMLEDGGLTDVSEPLLDAMLSLFPEDFSWQFRKAGFLRKFRAGAGAEEPARAALRFSHGDNTLRAAARLAEILDAGGRRAEALAVVDEALASPAPTEPGVRTHRYRKALQDLKDAWRPAPPAAPAPSAPSGTPSP